MSRFFTVISRFPLLHLCFVEGCLEMFGNESIVTDVSNPSLLISILLQKSLTGFQVMDMVRNLKRKQQGHGSLVRALNLHGLY